ncbi:hypothetical protein M8J76_004847 [Diaphorina citri]|nr:hypothetical protein M8J76_004847 [Diaphorina citri]
MEIKEKYIHSFRLPFDELINTKENNINKANKVTKNGGYNHNMEKWTATLSVPRLSPSKFLRGVKTSHVLPPAARTRNISSENMCEEAEGSELINCIKNIVRRRRKRRRCRKKSLKDKKAEADAIGIRNALKANVISIRKHVSDKDGGGGGGC